MTKKLTIRKQGNSLGVTFPKEMVGEFGFSEGAEVYVVHTPDGMLLTSYDADFEQALRSGDDFMRRFPNAMRKLAEG